VKLFLSLWSKWNIFGAYFFRWIGFPIEPDIIKVGTPDNTSPVLLTCNFSLTVKRVLKAVNHLDCYLLIAPSNGINVWCGACGDDFNTDSVISILKTSNIGELVSHRDLILPQLSAPGVDPIQIKNRIGWNVKFGPVYAKDIPNYISNNYGKSSSQREIKFPISKRLEMANMYFFILFLMVTLFYWILAIFFLYLNFYLYLDSILLTAIVIYGSLLILPSISTKTGKLKVWVFELGVIIMITFFYIYIHPNLFVFIWNICVSVLVSLIMSEDFHGLTPIYKSELGEKSWKKGKSEMKAIIGKFKLQPYGTITLDREKCIGCKMCLEVCPRNLYQYNEKEKKVNLIFPEKCINCNACVNQCLAKCLEITS